MNRRAQPLVVGGLDVLVERRHPPLDVACRIGRRLARRDARLVEETVTLTWFGLITQRTGEDWPPCPVTLSTARAAETTGRPGAGGGGGGSVPAGRGLNDFTIIGMIRDVPPNSRTTL